MSWRIPSSVSRKIVFTALVTSIGISGYFVYQRVVVGNPMRLGFDEEGVWSVISRRQHLEERLKVRPSDVLC